MGGAVSNLGRRQDLDAERLAAVAAEEQAKVAVEEAAEAKRREADAGVTLRRFQGLLESQRRELSCAIEEGSAEELSHAKHREEHERASAAFMQALGGVEALEHIELDRQNRRNIADDGTVVTEWKCDICQRVNPVERPLCETCARLRFPDDTGQHRRSASSVVVARKQELRAQARRSMAVVAATAGAAKRLTAARRRLRAVQATLEYLDQTGKTIHSVAWCRESEEMMGYLTAAEEAAGEAELALAGLDRVYEERMHAKRIYFQARGAKKFADEKRNVMLFEDFDEAKREAHSRLTATQREYIRAVIARRDGVKLMKETAAIEELRYSTLRALRRGIPAERVINALRDEAMELEAQTHMLLVSADVYREEAPKMFGTVGALEFLVDYKARHERTSTEAEWDAVIEECNVGLAEDKFNRQLLRWKQAAVKALSECKMKKEANVLKTRAECNAYVAAAWEGGVQVARVGRRQQLAHSAGLTTIQEMGGSAAKDASEQLSRHEAAAMAELDEANRVLGLSGGVEHVLQAARDAKARAKATTEAVIHLNEMWDAYPKAVVGMDPSKEEEALYESCRSATADKMAAEAAQASAEAAAQTILEMRSRRVDAVGKLAALQNLRGCLAVAEKGPGQFDLRPWRDAVDELRWSTEQQMEVGAGLLRVGTCSVMGQRALLEQMHKVRGRMLAVYSVLGSSKVKKRAAKSQLVARVLSATGTACATVADAKAHRIRYIQMLRQQQQLVLGNAVICADADDSADPAAQHAEQETEEAMIAIENRLKETQESQQAAHRQEQEEADVRTAELRLVEATEALNTARTEKERRGAEVMVAAARDQLDKEKAEAAHAALTAEREEQEAEVARQDATREAVEAAKARAQADKQRELAAGVPNKARHALTKQEVLRTNGAQDFLANMSMDFWSEPGSISPYPEGSTLEEIHQPKAFRGFLDGDRQIENGLRDRRIDLEKYSRSYGLARTKRLVFVCRVAAFDRDLLESTELAACKALIDDLRFAGERLLLDIDEFVALESHYKEALDWQKEAAEGDDIEEEDQADSLVANISQQLFSFKSKLASNTANADLYTEMMRLMRNRLHLPAYELEQGDKDLLVALDMQSQVRVESEAVQKRKRDTGKERNLLVRSIDQGKRDAKKFEYQLQRFEKESETARMAQDTDRHVECEEKCRELRGNLENIGASIEGWYSELQSFDRRMHAIEEESRKVGQRVARISEMKKAADALIAQGWAGKVREAIQKAEVIASGSTLGRLRYKEMHRDFDAAVKAWKHVPELETDPTLAVEVMRTCLCATHNDTMEKMMEKTLRKWLDKDTAAKLKDGKCSHLSQTELKQTTLLLFASAMLCLVRGQYEGARDTLLAIDSKQLGSDYSDIVTHAEIGMYGTLCVLATFEGAGDVHKLLYNRRFAPFLRKAPQARELAAELYAGNYSRVLAVMTALDLSLHLDVFVSAHRLELMQRIHANAQRVARTKRPFAIQSSLFTLLEVHRADSAASVAQKALRILQEGRHAEKEAKRQMISQLQSAADATCSLPQVRHVRAELLLSQLNEDSDEAYRHARNCFQASTGALGFIEDLKCSLQIEQAEKDTKQISKDDEPRQQPSEPQIEIAISNLFAALRSLGFTAGVDAARSAAQQRSIVTTARRSGTKTLLNVIREVEQIMLAAEAAAMELAEAEAAKAAAEKETEEARQAVVQSQLEAGDVHAAQDQLAEKEALVNEAEDVFKEAESASAAAQATAATQLQELEVAASAAAAEAAQAAATAEAAEDQDANPWMDDVENLPELQAARDRTKFDAETAEALLRRQQDAEAIRHAAAENELAAVRDEVEKLREDATIARGELDRERKEAAEAAQKAQREQIEAAEAQARADREAAEARQALENAETESRARGGSMASSTMQECKRKLNDMQARAEIVVAEHRPGSVVSSDPLAKLRESKAVIDNYRKISDRAKGVLWFVGCDQARKAEEEAKVRLLKAATERAQAQLRTRATAQTLRLRTKEANQKEAQRLTAQTELYAALKLAEETRAEYDELKSQIEKIEQTPAGNMYEMRRLNKEQAELEAQSTIVKLRADRNGAHALHLQELYNTIRAVATAAATAKVAAQEAHAEATARNAGDAATASKLSIIGNLRTVSGRVDEYGRQLNLLQTTQSRRVNKCLTECEAALEHYYVVSETCRVEAFIQGQASMAAWLANKLDTMRTDVGESRKHEQIFRKVRKVTRGIIQRHLLAKNPEGELYYYTPDRKSGERHLHESQRAWRAADEAYRLAKGAYEGARATAIKSEMDEIKLQLQKVEYQCERTFRKVKDLTKKQLQNQLKVEQELLDELKAEESVLHERQAALQEELHGADIKFLELTEVFKRAEEDLLKAEGEKALAQAEVASASKTEKQAQQRAKAFLERLEREGIVFTAEGDDEAAQGKYKNRFKDLLMRKILDGQLSTPWTIDDEREFRQKFTEGLGGSVRKSELAAGLRKKESSLVARLGGYS